MSSPSIRVRTPSTAIPTRLTRLQILLHAPILLVLALNPFPALAQSPPTLVPNSIQLHPSPASLSFQFTADPIPSQIFQIESTTNLHTPIAWSPFPQAEIAPLLDHTFQVNLPTPLPTSFFRIVSLPLPNPTPTLWLNEVCPDNVSQFKSEDGSFYDWIEIFNPNDEAVDLQGFGLSDDPLSPLKWQFPPIVIQPLGFLLVQASDLNKTNALQPLHTNFKLKASGETIALSNPQGVPIDQWTIPALQQDQSYGRSPDAGPDFAVFSKTQATPGKANGTPSQAPPLAPPQFIPEGGFHNGPVIVQLKPAAPDHQLHYTTDGSLPHAQSPLWTQSLVLTQSTVIRVLSINSQNQKSLPTSHTYLIQTHHDLPVISISTSPTNMSFKDGYLYGMGSAVLNNQNQVLQSYPFSGSNAWKDREVEVGIEFFEPDGSLGFRQQAGMKIYGGWGSRGYPQKSLALFARRAYGAGSFKHPLFPDQSLNEFESFVLRNSGNDNQSTHQTPVRTPITQFGPTTTYGSYFVNGTFTLLRDAFMQSLLSETTLDTQAYRPAIVYINGEYWGLYNIREKITEHHVTAHHSLPQGSVDLIEGYGTVRAGTGTVYNQLRQLMSSRNLAVSSNYNLITTQYLDVDNFIDYHLAVIYFQNFDIGNIKCWRPRIPGGKFRWLVYDQDYGFGLWPASIYIPAMARDYADYSNMFTFYTAGSGTSDGWPNAGGRTLMLRSLLANPEFKERFITRCADLLNSSFREDRVTNQLSAMAQRIRPEIQSHLERWSWNTLTQRGYGKPHQPEYQPFIPSTWESNLLVVAQFGLQRPTQLRQDCLKHFKLTRGTGSLQIQTDPPSSATLLVNSLEITENQWSGTYFGDYQTTVRALPKPGFQWSHWSTPEGSSTNNPLQISVSTNGPVPIVAHLIPAAPSSSKPPELQFHEIQYHPASNAESGDWIELINPTDHPVSTSGWLFRDSDDSHAFPLPAQTLAPGETWVIAQDTFQFQMVYTNTVRTIGNFRFGLGNGGDSLRLFRPDGSLAVQVNYSDASPWPEGADATGHTLQLRSPNADASLPESWTVSPAPKGTPGIP